MKRLKSGLLGIYLFDYKPLSTVSTQKKAFGGFGAVFLLLVFVVLIVYKKNVTPGPGF